MTFQFDLGNGLVGLGTICLAFITYYLTNKNITEGRRISDREFVAEGNRRLAEKRLDWIESLRKELAELLAVAINQDSNDRERLDKLNYHAVVIAFRLTEGKQEHEKLIDKLQEILSIAQAAQQGERKLSTEENKRLVTFTREAIETARPILRREWETVKTELKSENGVK